MILRWGVVSSSDTSKLWQVHGKYFFLKDSDGSESLTNHQAVKNNK